MISCKSLLKVISSRVHADTTEHKETVTGESNRNKAKEYQLLAAINNQLPKDVIEILGDAKESGDRITSVNIVPYFCMGDLPNEYVSLIIDKCILTHLLCPKGIDIGQEYFPKNKNCSCMIPNKYYSDLAINK